MLTHENNKKTLLEIIDQDSLSLEDKNLKLKLENQIQYYYEIQFQGTRIRSKTQKVVNETPSKSFSGIEINKARQKNITQLMNESEKLISDKDEVLDETRFFYKKTVGRRRPKHMRKIAK